MCAKQRLIALVSAASRRLPIGFADQLTRQRWWARSCAATKTLDRHRHGLFGPHDDTAVLGRPHTDAECE
ncbi:hypothetical protein ACU4GD_34250 [Cupriavidus basilensis]